MRVKLPQPITMCLGVMHRGVVPLDPTVEIEGVWLKSATTPHRPEGYRHTAAAGSAPAGEWYIWSIVVRCLIPSGLTQYDGRPSPLAGQTMLVELRPWSDSRNWEPLLDALVDAGCLLRPVRPALAA